MKKEINICNLYIVLYLISFFQSFSDTSRLVALASYIPSVIITLYCFYKIVSKGHVNSTLSVWMFLFVYLLIYGIFSVASGGAVKLGALSSVKNTMFILMVLSSLGPVIAFYYFSCQGLLTERHLLFWLLVFSISSVLSYYNYQESAIDSLGQYSSFQEVTNNKGYAFVGLIPFVFFLRKRSIIQYAVLFFLLAFVILSMKRGAILIGCILTLWFVIISTKNASKNKKWIIIGLSIIAIIIGWDLIIKLYENSDYFQYRIQITQEGYTSHRDENYLILWQHFLNRSDFFQILFGEGAYYTYTVAGNDAHNDWLELLIDCGIIGVIIYLIYYIRFLKDWLSSKSNYLVYSAIGACFIFMFLRSFFSMGFSDMPFHTSMILGYCFYLVQLNKFDIQKSFE